MKNKKVIAIITSALVLTTLIVNKPIYVSADIKGDTILDIKESISEIAPLQSKSITVNNQSIDLYVEFSDSIAALDGFKEKYKSELEFIKQNLNLEEVTIENWEDYYNNIKLIEDLVTYIPDNVLDSQLSMLGFFDIFENSFKNDEIIRYTKSNSKSISISTSKELENLKYMLPYTSEINLNQISTNQISPMSTYGINLTNAINYASKYGPAGAYNSPTYQYFTFGDCTNFLSQILVAGGVSQSNTSNINSGWWFKRTNSTDPYNPYIYTSSYSWIRADTFAKYWGVSYTTKSHAAFSGKLNTGDIIGYDESSDGDWDHLGFITASDNYTANYNGKIYYDYKVAQHTRDYNAWTSTSTNGWENLEDDGYTYGIIRR